MIAIWRLGGKLPRPVGDGRGATAEFSGRPDYEPGAQVIGRNENAGRDKTAGIIFGELRCQRYLLVLPT
jgi:hypothetical protein